MDAGAFAFALPDLGALIAAPLHFAHDDDLGEWPPPGFRGDFDALGFDFQAHANAPSRDDEASWIPNWIEHDEDLSSVGVAAARADDPRAAARDRDGDRDGDGDGAHSGTASPAAASPASPAGRRLDAEETRRMRAAMRRNPRYPALLDAYFACRCVGANDAGVAAADARKRQLLAEAETAAGATGGNHLAPGFGAELDDFMTDCTAELVKYAEELRETCAEANKLCAEFEARAAQLGRMRLDESTGGGGGVGGGGGEVNVAGAGKRRKVPAKRVAAASIAGEGGEGANGGVGVGGGVGASADAREDCLRESLKRKYASSILSLKDEFLKKRKKGKLPAVATDALKEWWRERVVWPYPTEADKATLGRRTGLNPTQINNWFINQRKRHWHKLFPDAQPATAEEASGALVRRFGSLQAALDIARRA